MSDMTESDGGTCRAETKDGDSCGNDAQDGDITCYLHDESDIPGSAAERDSDDLPEMPEKADFQTTLSNGWTVAEMVMWLNRTPDNATEMDEPELMDKAAKTVAHSRVTKERDEWGTVEAYTAAFGPCEKCGDGSAGFNTEYCKSCEPEDNDESEESGDGDTMTVTINGQEVTGTPAEVKALMDEMDG
jgi:hypothetical protein